MKASEIVNRYANGERDFRGVSLRGLSFKGKNLSGADFSSTDIRGTNFTEAILVGANFSGAKAGISNVWVFILAIFTLILSALFAFLPAIAGAVAGANFTEIVKESLTNIEELKPFFAVLLILTTSVPLVHMVIRQGLVGASFTLFCLLALGTINWIPIVLELSDFQGFNAIAVTIAWGGVGTFFQIVFGAIFGVLFGILFDNPKFMSVIGATFGSVIVFWVAVVTEKIILDLFPIERDALFGGVIVVLVGSLLGSNVAWSSLAKNKKYISVHNIAIIFSTFKGTSFCKANLTDANFTGAKLKSTDLREANLTRTCWRNVQQLDRVRPGKKFLEILQLHEWLINKQGTEKNFDKLDFRGVNLQGANLTEMSFIGADLSEANLQDADLSKAKLVQTQLDKTDLTGANLTGAYIEEWNITTETKLDGIRCEYIFMRLPPDKRPDWLQLTPAEKLDPNPRRKPEDWEHNFAEGEFADFIAPMVQTLDLYHNKTVDPRLVAIAYRQLKEDNPDAELELVSVEKKGKNKEKLLLRSETNSSADHGVLNANYFANLEYLQSLPPEAKQALLTERGATIQMMAAIIGAGQNHQVSINNQQGDKNMSGDKTINTGGGNYNESIGGDYIQVNQGDNINQSGSTFGIGINKGTVNAQNIAGNINQSSDEVKKMIANLRKQVEALENQVVRSEALEYVEDLEAEIIESPNPKQSRIKSSLNMLLNVGKDVALVSNAVTALAVRFGVNL